MAGSMRVTRKAAASIVFGLGSFILMADVTQIVIVNGDQGGNIFRMGFPSPIGWSGFLLWSIGTIMLISIRFSGKNIENGDTRRVFLKGRDEFRCRSCKKMIATGEIDYSDRVTCDCGAMHEVYQEPERT